MAINIDRALDIARMINVKTPYVVKEEEKPAKKKPSKKLKKYLNNTVANAPNAKELHDAVLYSILQDKPVTYCGEDINMNIHAKSAPYKGYTSDSGVDVNKEFQKALDKGKKYGMHRSNKGRDPFLSEIEKSLSYDPLNKK